MSGKRLIQLGLILVVVVSAFATTASAKAWSACGGTYVVQRGDWLAKIARIYMPSIHGHGTTITSTRGRYW